MERDRGVRGSVWEAPEEAGCLLSGRVRQALTPPGSGPASPRKRWGGRLVCSDCLASRESWESRSSLENRGAGRLGKVCKAESGLVAKDLRLGQKGPARNQGLLHRTDTSSEPLSLVVTLFPET